MKRDIQYIFESMYFRYESLLYNSHIRRYRLRIRQRALVDVIENRRRYDILCDFLFYVLKYRS